MKFVIEPDDGLNDWVAQEKGYFTEEVPNSRTSRSKHSEIDCSISSFSKGVADKASVLMVITPQLSLLAVFREAAELISLSTKAVLHRRFVVQPAF